MLVDRADDIIYTYKKLYGYDTESKSVCFESRTLDMQKQCTDDYDWVSISIPTNFVVHDDILLPAMERADINSASLRDELTNAKAGKGILKELSEGIRELERLAATTTCSKK